MGFYTRLCNKTSQIPLKDIQKAKELHNTRPFNNLLLVLCQIQETKMEQDKDQNVNKRARFLLNGPSTTNLFLLYSSDSNSKFETIFGDSAPSSRLRYSCLALQRVKINHVEVNKIEQILPQNIKTTRLTRIKHKAVWTLSCPLCLDSAAFGPNDLDL